MGSFSQAVPPTAPYKQEMSGAIAISFEQVKDKIEETRRQSSQNMEQVSNKMVPKEEFNELRNQVNEMKDMLIKIMTALEKESKEDKPV